MSKPDYLGRGWAIPMHPDPRSGRLELRAGLDKVKQAIYLILDTEPGERVMRPTFGCGLRRYLMMPNSTATRALIRRDVEAAITVWEPRVQLSGVRVEAADDEPSLVLIEVSFVIIRDGRPGNLVYPFYLER